MASSNYNLYTVNSRSTTSPLIPQEYYANYQMPSSLLDDLLSRAS
ncbi:hypothetical protein PPL_03747 [Heterostelium album PN500]|uniref:Uncharacterized protein n=1 Tax=Heterostelium pallidum (strain ATCC 26659 / Pp 5 / PN500) TaxID=670386 RepID=D3B6J9_HETP5|nr:hypothetical protein PPL_03747 [Heterostelium album PN500]EFA82969.1 hypothetical protein PPL_03747 [Heterostelium album PN500]|eukprot:XP_020435086.1 hypothetical protein PPL_03747 [Heterostelium album PN500]